MHLIDNGAIEIEVETGEEAALAALAAAQEVFDDAGVTPAAASGTGLWEQAQQAAARASGGEARIALKGTAAAFSESLSAGAQEAERAPFTLEQPIGGFEPEGPEFL
jgi:hypothetical protein